MICSILCKCDMLFTCVDTVCECVCVGGCGAYSCTCADMRVHMRLCLLACVHACTYRGAHLYTRTSQARARAYTVDSHVSVQGDASASSSNDLGGISGTAGRACEPGVVGGSRSNA